MQERQGHRGDARVGRARLPRWPAAAGLLVVGALYTVISDGLTFGPGAFFSGSWPCCSCL